MPETSLIVNNNAHDNDVNNKAWLQGYLLNNNFNSIQVQLGLRCYIILIISILSIQLRLEFHKHKARKTISQ